jgi:hypothetical protein
VFPWKGAHTPIQVDYLSIYVQRLYRGLISVWDSRKDNKLCQGHLKKTRETQSKIDGLVPPWRDKNE